MKRGLNFKRYNILFKRNIIVLLLLLIILIIFSIFLISLFYKEFISKGISLAPAVITVNGGGQTAIENAIAQANPGDIIEVSSGNYDDNSQTFLTISSSGTATASITLRGVGTPAPKIGNIKFSDASYWIVENFEISNQQAFNSIEFTGILTKNNILRNMLIHDVRSGIALKEGDSNTIENSIIYNTIDKSGSPSQEAHAIHINSAKNNKILNNIIYGMIGDAVQMLTVSRDANNNPILINRGTTLIEGNKIYNTQGPCAENAIDVKAESGTVIVRKNVMYGFEPMTGVGCTYKASGEPEAAAVIAHQNADGTLIIEQNEFYDTYQAIDSRGMKTTISNNIFHDFKSGTRVGSSRVLGVFASNSNQKIYHNTFVNIPSLFNDLISGGSPDLANNLFYNVKRTITGNYRYSGWFGNNDQKSGTGDVTGTDPFINADYSLQSASPLIDKALTGLNINNDFKGVSRPYGPAPDIGAFEYNAQVTSCTDNDGDGYGTGCSLGNDCNDGNSAINPKAQEVCGDNIDNNCDGRTDDICTVTSLTFAAAGDHGYGTQLLSTLDVLKQSQASFYLALGDMSYSSPGTETDWCNTVKSRLGSSYPFELAPGNHEDDDGPNGFIGDFASCLPDRMSSTGKYPAEYYFDYQVLARIIMISPDLSITGSAYNYNQGGTHYNWLSQTIDDARAKGIPWVIVGMHKNCITMATKSCEIGTDLMNLLISKNVDLILQGHDHTYQRSKQLSCIAVNNYKSSCIVDDGSDNIYAKGKGPIIVIAGAFGKSLYDIDTADSEAGYFAKWMGDNIAPSYGFVKYTLSSTELSAEYISSSGTFKDSFSIKKETQAQAERIIIDNLDSGFSTQGTWPISNGASQYGSDSVYSRTPGESAAWTTSLTPGLYEVYAWWTSWPSRSQNTPYKIYNGNALLNTVRVNQNDSNLAGKWNLLGEYNFDAPARIILEVETTNSHNADAVSFIRKGDTQAPTTTPTISLISPENKEYKNRAIPLIFTASNAAKCWFVLDGISSNANCNTVMYLTLSAGQHTLTVFAENSLGQVQEQRTFSLKLTRRYLVKYANFAKSATATTNLDDLTDQQLENVSLLTLDDGQYAKIEFQENINLTQDANATTNEIDIDSNVVTSLNKIELKSDAMPSLNKKAKLTLKVLSFSDPIILKDNSPCSDCVKESYSDGNLVFNVTGFSVYSAQERPSEGGGEGDGGGGGGGGGGGCGTVEECQTGGNKTTGVKNITDTQRKQKVLVREDVKFFYVKNNEEVILNVNGNDYISTFKISKGLVYIDFFNEEYELPKQKAVKLSAESTDFFIGNADISRGTALIVVSLDEKGVNRELGIISEKKKKANLRFTLIFAIVVIILMMGVVSYYIVTISRAYIKSKKETPQWVKEKRFVVKKAETKNF